MVLGFAMGLMLGLLWRHPLSLVAWGLAFVVLGAVGWRIRPLPVSGPRLTRTGAEPRQPTSVIDGPFQMTDLPGGTFWMGSLSADAMASDDERPRHRVRVAGFRICQVPVTRDQWRKVMKVEDWGYGGGTHPAIVSYWEDALVFCNRLSERQGYRRCYRLVGLKRRRRWVCDWRADGYRLPTEAEWEYACRAGTDTRWPFGDGEGDLEYYAWFAGNSGGDVHAVGEKRPNSWELFDMHGNTQEWCWDWYGPYEAVEQTDPRGPLHGEHRVMRGGSGSDPPVLLRSAARTDGVNDVQRRSVGFRCVRVPGRRYRAKTAELSVER